ncbi:unnamed protein product [Diamesa serratosioi]
MLTPSGLSEIKDRIHLNDEKVQLLTDVNVILKERHEIESNYNHLNIKFNQMQKDESERKEKYDHSRKHYLTELESRGGELCKEHAKILHQIEHINWHLEGCTRHRPCQGRQQESCTKKGVTPSCASLSAPTCTRPSAVDLSCQANLKNTSERLIKSIVDLRKKIYTVQEKLEHEIKRKKDMEKKLSELRKDISRQKKSLTLRRNNAHTPLTTSMTATSTASHCPGMQPTHSQQLNGSCSSLPPIKKSLLAK